MILSVAQRSIIRAAQREHAKDKRFVINAKFAGQASGLKPEAASNQLTSLKNAGYLRDTGLRDKTSPGAPRLFEPTKKLLVEPVMDKIDEKAIREEVDKMIMKPLELELTVIKLPAAPAPAPTPTAPAAPSHRDEVVALTKELRHLKGKDGVGGVTFLLEVLRDEVDLYRQFRKIDQEAKGVVQEVRASH